jgi:Beta-propeller repeat
MNPHSARSAAARRIALPATLAVCLFALFATVPAAHAAPGDLAWAKSYDGVGQNLDYFSAVVPAPNGGVYVAGLTVDTTADFIVVRYDALGGRPWLHTYDGPQQGPDYANDAAVDRHGNLIAVGQVDSPSTKMAVLKYAPSGQRRWVRIYDDPASSAEAATGVAVDQAGNEYVVGTSRGATSGPDIILVKYSAAGALRWVRHYSAPGNDIDQPSGVALDAYGNVYVTGFSYASGNYDIVTLKYDSSGHRRWVRRWDGPAGGDDLAWAIAVTGSGTVYVAGRAGGVSSGGDAVVLKYGSGGTLKWSRARSGPGANIDEYLALTLMGNGDVVATGTIYNAAVDVLTTRFTSSGGTRWQRTYDGPDGLDDVGNRVTHGPRGAIYVAGFSFGSATGGDVLTLKYSGAGVPRWDRRYTSSPAVSSDYDRDLALSAGALYVAGSQQGGVSSDALLLKYVP